MDNELTIRLHAVLMDAFSIDEMKLLLRQIKVRHELIPDHLKTQDLFFMQVIDFLDRRGNALTLLFLQQLIKERPNKPIFIEILNEFSSTINPIPISTQPPATPNISTSGIPISYLPMPLNKPVSPQPQQPQSTGRDTSVASPVGMSIPDKPVSPQPTIGNISIAPPISIPTPNKPVSLTPAKVFQGCSGHVETLGIASDGSSVAFVVKGIGLCLCSIADGARSTFQLSNIVDVKALTWSPQREYVAIAGTKDGDKTGVFVVNLQTGNIHTFKQHTSPVTALAWSPGGEYVISASEDVIHVWRHNAHSAMYSFKDHVPPSREQRPTREQRPITALTCSRDEQIAFSTMNNIYMRQYKSNQHTSQKFHEGSRRVEALAWSPDGQHVLASSGLIITMWTKGALQLKDRTYLKHKETRVGAAIKALSWSPNGNYVASAGISTPMHVWDAKNATCLYVCDDATNIDAVLWHQNNLITVSKENQEKDQRDKNEICLWELPRGI